MRSYAFSFAFVSLASFVACGGSAFTSATSGDAGIGTDSGIQLDVGGDDGGGESDAGSCVPKTCPGNKWICGAGGDGCGAILDCGACRTVNFACHDHACLCAPKSCSDLGFQCGTAPDGCGSTVACTPCPTGETCGGGGPNRCGTGKCTPATCSYLNAQCGSISDGCGNTLQCGACPTGDVCGANGTPNQCACTPKTCAQLGVICGPADDGCGNTLDCGSPKTCANLGWACGSGSDGCGGTLDCGGCSSNASCGANHQCGGSCTPMTCFNEGYTCGAFVDSCGTSQTCGPKPVAQTSTTSPCTDGVHTQYYTCPCAVPLAPSMMDGGGGGILCGVGPTPPEPGMNCVAAGQPSGTGNNAWCCTP